MPCNVLVETALALAFTASSIPAAAICLLPQVFYVGDTATDTQCTQNDIQSAIDAVSCPNATIYVTREHIYDSQHLTISGKSLRLVGEGNGVTCGQQLCLNNCGGTPITTPQVTLNGDASGDSVIHIDGTSNVDLRYLTISGGHVSSSNSGGGVYFGGSGSLTLDTSTISNNEAGYGGGIDISPSGGSATLTLNAYSLILNNIADVSGGGIRIEGDTQLVDNGDPSIIAYNDAATGYGGGVEVIGPARADIGSPGYNGLGVLYDNTAQYGGGIAALGASGNGNVNGIANFYTTDPERPTAIQGNFAGTRGGAIYGRGKLNAGYPNYGEICAANARISDNAAPDGAAAYLDSDSDIFGDLAGSALVVNTLLSSTCGGPAGVACAPGAGCNEAYGNVSLDSGSNPTNGSAIVTSEGSDFNADKLDLRGSTGIHAIDIMPDSGSVLLEHCLIADNDVGDNLIENNAYMQYSYAPSTLTIDSCTIAGNTIGNQIGNPDILDNSLVYQPGLHLIFPQGPTTGAQNVQAQYDLVNDTTDIQSATTVQIVGDPLFVDAAHGNYHLQLESPAVDYAGGSGGTDLDGFPYDVDLPTISNVFGPRDVGAYERQSAYACDNSEDYVFCSSFEP